MSKKLTPTARTSTSTASTGTALSGVAATSNADSSPGSSSSDCTKFLSSSDFMADVARGGSCAIIDSAIIKPAIISSASIEPAIGRSVNTISPSTSTICNSTGIVKHSASTLNHNTTTIQHNTAITAMSLLPRRSKFVSIYEMSLASSDSSAISDNTNSQDDELLKSPLSVPYYGPGYAAKYGDPRRLPHRIAYSEEQARRTRDRIKTAASVQLGKRKSSSFSSVRSSSLDTSSMSASSTWLNSSLDDLSQIQDLSNDEKSGQKDVHAGKKRKLDAESIVEVNVPIRQPAMLVGLPRNSVAEMIERHAQQANESTTTVENWRNANETQKSTVMDAACQTADLNLPISTTVATTTINEDTLEKSLPIPSPPVQLSSSPGKSLGLGNQQQPLEKAITTQPRQSALELISNAAKQVEDTHVQSIETKIISSDTAKRIALDLPIAMLKLYTFDTPSPNTRLLTSEHKLTILQIPITELPIYTFSSTTTTPTTSISPSSTLLQKSMAQNVNKWTCSVCLVSNNDNAIQCVACETENPGSTIDKSPEITSSFTFSTNSSQPSTTTATTFSLPSTIFSGFNGFKSASFSGFPSTATPSPFELLAQKLNACKWTCDVCMTPNDNTATQCAACESPKPGSTSDDTTTTNSSAIPFQPPPSLPTPKSASFSFQPPPLFPSSSDTTINSTSDLFAGFKGFGALPTNIKPLASSTTSTNRTDAGGPWTCDVCLVPNKGATTQCIACESPKP